MMKRMWTIINTKGKRITAEQAEKPSPFFLAKEEAKAIRDKLNASAGIDPSKLENNGNAYRITKGPDHPKR